MRRLASALGAAWWFLVFAAQASADTQGSTPTAAPGDGNVWLGVVMVVLLVASLIVVRPRTRR